MDWTGYLYSFYSNKKIESVFDKFITILANNFNFQVDRNYYDDEFCLLAYKDENMRQEHDKLGYHLNKDGLGCIGVEAKPVSTFNSIAMLHTFDDKNDFEPYDINIVLNDISYFLLVLPESIDDSSFSKNIFEDFRKILLEGDYT